MKKLHRMACLIQDSSTLIKINKAVSKLAFEIVIIPFVGIADLIQKIEENNIDYLLVDMETRDDDYKSILQTAKNKYPSVIRILLADTWSMQLVITINQTAHLIVEKKKIETNFINIFTKAEKLRGLFKNDNLIKIINTFDEIPIIKSTYMELLQKLQGEEFSLKEIGEFIESDLALSTKVIQVSNMSIFAKLTPITSAKQAVVFLGVNVLRALIIYNQLTDVKNINSSMLKICKSIQDHSMCVAETSKALAIDFQYDNTKQNDCFMTGLVHDIGKLVLATKINNWDEIQEYAVVNNIPMWQAEEAILGTSHAEVGAYLLGIWGFPPEVIDAIAHHHKPHLLPSDKVSLTTIVHVADAMSQVHARKDEEIFTEHLDNDYMNSLGLENKVHELYGNYFGRKQEKESIETIDDKDRDINSKNVPIEVVEENNKERPANVPIEVMENNKERPASGLIEVMEGKNKKRPANVPIEVIGENKKNKKPENKFGEVIGGITDGFKKLLRK